MRNKQKKKEEKEIDNYFSINFHINKKQEERTPPTGYTPSESSVFRSDYILNIKKRKNSVNSVYKVRFIYFFYFFCVRLLYCCLLLDLVVKHKLGDNRTNTFIVSHIYFIADFFQLICCCWCIAGGGMECNGEGC